MGTRFDQFLGGKGFNQAVAAARSGAATAMVGRLGDDDFGRQFRAGLSCAGIDDRHVHTDQSEGTGIGLPLVEDSGENSIVVVPRANHRVTVDDVSRAERRIARADVLLLQLEIPMAACVAAATIAHRAGVTVVLNPAPAVDRIDGFAGLVDVVVPNEIEARRLTRAPADADAADLARRLRELVHADVVVTLGADGALLLDDDGPTHLAAHPVTVLDTVGAGDAFCGGLGAQLAAGSSGRDAVAYANAAAALAVTKPGAAPSIPTIDEVVARFDPASPVRRAARAAARRG
jgi:ribokinase